MHMQNYDKLHSLLPAVRLWNQVSLRDKPTQKIIASRLLAHNQGFALALFPAVTVSSGRGALQLAVMTLVTYFGTFSAAT